MKDNITRTYCLCADFLRAMNYRDDIQATLSNAEVMTVAVVAARFFGGNSEQSLHFLHSHGYFTRTLSKSQLNRRLHALPAELWHTLLRLLGEVFKSHNTDQHYVVDSLPVPVCDNIRIKACKLLPLPAPLPALLPALPEPAPVPDKEAYRGYCASKRRYFFGFKLHLLITGHGAPVEFVLTPGSCADISAFKEFTLDLPVGALIHADRAYTDYAEEDLLQAAGGLTLQPQRKKNAKRLLPLCKEFVSKPIRQRIETSFSQLTNLFPKHIHAVTARGFVLKIICFLLAFAIQCL